MRQEQEVFFSNLQAANIQRTIYLLDNYHRYRQNQSSHLDVKTSRLILQIVAECVNSRPDFSDGDRALFDKSGALLCLGIQAAMDEIRDLPWDAGQQIYPILWEQYFHPDGPAISTDQLQERLNAADTLLEMSEIETLLKAGHNAMATLILKASYCHFGRIRYCPTKSSAQRSALRWL